jgi:5-methylcytosine-specific restriction endonuclease McrA
MSCETSTCCEIENRHARTVLLLNASEEIISVIDWTRAITLLFAGKAIKPYNYEEYHEIQTTSGIFQLPTALVLVEYVHIPYRSCPMTRRNILRRDRGQCQYCAKKLGKKEFTIDHVIPRSRGGKNSWVNLVSCCLKCNWKKGDKTPDEANMKLLRTPTEPMKDYIHVIGIDNNNNNHSWNRWIELKGDINESI